MPALARYLAYTPEGPLIDWSTPDLSAWLDPMQEYLRERGAFAVRIGPPVTSRVWEASTVKRALADDSQRRLGGVPPDDSVADGLRVEDTLRSARWQPPPARTGFPAGQPPYVVQVPLRGQTEESLLAAMSSQWRRNIEKARAAKLELRAGADADLPAFHRIYLDTARRNGFRPRSAKYFETMHRALDGETGPDPVPPGGSSRRARRRRDSRQGRRARLVRLRRLEGARMVAAELAQHPQRRADRVVGRPATPGAVGLDVASGIPGEEVAPLARQQDAILEAP